MRFACQVWGEARSAPAAVSLQDVFAEQDLPTILAEGVQCSNIDVAKSTAMLLGVDKLKTLLMTANTIGLDLHAHCIP